MPRRLLLVASTLLAVFSSIPPAGAVDRGPLQSQRLSAEDGLVQVRDWFGFAQDKVPTLTKLYFGREQLVSAKSEGRNFPLLPVVTKED